MAENGKSQPSFTAFQVSEREEGEAYFNRVGAAFAHKDGQGHTVQLDSIPVDGRIVLRAPQDRLAETKESAPRAPEKSRRTRRTRDEYER